MKLLFKQRLFSWFDSYDIYGENGETVYTVEGQLSWGHCLHILDASGNHIATVKQVIFTWMPKYDIYVNDEYMGTLKREFTFFRPSYTLDFCGWDIEGNYMEWDYSITSGSEVIAEIDKELFNWTDTYTIDVYKPENALYALCVVLAIDAEKCSRSNS